MKYYFRRFILAVILFPFIAGAYTFAYLAILLMGAEPTATLDEVVHNGMLIATVLGLALIFQPQFSKLLDKLS